MAPPPAHCRQSLVIRPTPHVGTPHFVMCRSWSWRCDHLEVANLCSKNSDGGKRASNGRMCSCWHDRVGSAMRTMSSVGKASSAAEEGEPDQRRSTEPHISRAQAPVAGHCPKERRFSSGEVRMGYFPCGLAGGGLEPEKSNQSDLDSAARDLKSDTVPTAWNFGTRPVFTELQTGVSGSTGNATFWESKDVHRVGRDEASRTCSLVRLFVMSLVLRPCA